MKTFGALSALALALAVAECSPPASVSGTYGYMDDSATLELVLTESAQQDMLGSMRIASLQKDGSMRRQVDSITGVRSQVRFVDPGGQARWSA
jgi:hypothetical protein